MTDIDTTKIRTRPVPTRPLVLALCDALDEARAERDGWELAAGHRMELLIEREERAEAAEARIAAALLIGHTLTSPCDEHCQINNVRRALTGGTK